MKRPLILLFGLLCAAAPAAAQESFYGYPCTQDCSGHKAGYEWALKKGLTDAADCGGNSQSFIEGCHAAVEESHIDPAAIEPAAGAFDAADPSIAEDPFVDDPFIKDPFEPDALPGIGSDPFGQ